MKKKSLDIKFIQQTARTLKAIAHPCRLRIVEILAGGEKSVSDLMLEMKSCQVSVSKHLAVLKKEGIVSCRSEGSFRYYQIENKKVINILSCLNKCQNGCGEEI